MVRQLIQSLNALGWRLFLLLQNYLLAYFYNGIPKTQHIILSMFSKISNNSIQVNHDQFCHQKLSKAELLKGCRLGIYSWADTGCASKHAYVEEFIYGRTVNVTVFAPYLGSFKNNLLFVNIIYAYDTPSGKTVLLDHNNVIYLGPTMEDGLDSPIQSEENDVRIDIQPKTLYGEDISSQKIKFPDGTILPIAYDNVLPYLPVRRPTYE